MNIDFRGLRFRLFIYLFMLSAVIIFILWCIQILFVDNYFIIMRTSELKNTASEIIENIQADDFENVVFKLQSEENIALEITDSFGNSLINRGDRVIMISPPRMVSLFVSREHGNLNNRIRRIAIRNIPNPVLNNAKHKLISEERNTISYVQSNNPFKMLVYGQKFEKSGHEDAMYLFLTSDLPGLASTTKMLKNQIIYISISLFFLTFVLSIIMSKKLSKPIVNITNSAKILATGNYSIKFEGNSYSEINMLADTLNYATSEMSKVDTMRKELIANVSHDLRTPLTMIKAYAEMIRDLSGNNPEKRDKHLKVIIDESDRLSLLVNDLLDLSKVESGNIKINYQKFNISKTMLNLMERYSFLIEKEGYVFNIKCEDNLFVYADWIRIVQVIYNLINNSINYTGEDKMIYVRLFKVKNKVRFEVEDTGEGIPQSQLSSIWERYYKIDKVHKRAIVGNGLGLSIVKNILTLHNASFGVVSNENSGCLFWFELKLVKS